MDEEIKESQWLQPSSIGSEYAQHEQAMRPSKEVPIDMAFGLPAGFNVGMLRKIAEAYRPKKIVVIDHGENGYEVRRLGDFADVKSFYASLSKTDKSEPKDDESSNQIEDIKRIIVEYLQSSDEMIVRYDAKGVDCKNVSCVSYSYIQRRVAPLASFRKASAGNSKAIKNALMLLEDQSLIRQLPKEETLDLLKINAVVYRINKSAFED